MIGMAVNGAPLARITLADVQAYEALDWDLIAQNGVNPWGGFVFSGYKSYLIGRCMAMAGYCHR